MVGASFFVLKIQAVRLSNVTNGTKWNYFSHICKTKIALRGGFFMDIFKICNKVMENPEIQSIPYIYVVKVIRCVIEAISSGECFYETEYE